MRADDDDEEKREEVSGERATTNRRLSPRAWVSATVCLVVDAGFLGGGPPSGVPLSFYGHARDVSDSGVAVVVPAVNFDARACAWGHPLLIRLEIAGEWVEAEAEAVHCRPTGGGESPPGVLVGAKVHEVRMGALTYPAAHLGRLLKPRNLEAR